LGEILGLLREKDSVFKDVRRRTNSLHRPREQVAGRFPNDEWDTTDAYSIFSELAEEDRFNFDDDILQSAAYRRVYHSVRNGRRPPYRHRARLEPTVNLLEEDLIELHEHPPLLATYSMELRNEMSRTGADQQPVGPPLPKSAGSPELPDDHNLTDEVGTTTQELPVPIYNSLSSNPSATAVSKDFSPDSALHRDGQTPDATIEQPEVNTADISNDGHSLTGEDKILDVPIITLGRSTNLRVGLIGASAFGRIDDVHEHFLRSNVNIKESDLQLSLLYASLNGHAEVVDLLLVRGANVNSQYSPSVEICSGWHRNLSPLHLAAANNHTSIIELLLKCGANIAQVDNLSWSSLHFAAARESASAVKLLLQNGAAIEAKASLALVAIGAAPPYPQKSAMEINGCTPLFLSAFFGAGEVLKVLLDNGANKRAKAGFGLTLLHAAAGGCHNYTGRFRRSLNNSLFSTIWLEHIQLLHPSAQKARFRARLLEYLISIGCDLEAVDNFEFQPIHIACLHDNVDSVKVLIKHTANLSTTTRFGWTPLHLAALGRSVEIAEALIKAGARVNVQFGRQPESTPKAPSRTPNAGAQSLEESLTPLGLAVATGNAVLAIYLLKNGADPIMPASPNLSVLHVAALIEQSSMLVLLSKQGLDFKNTDAESKSIVPEAYVKTALLSLSHRVDINTLDETGSTPLLRFLHSGWYYSFDMSLVIHRLLKLGADPRVCDRQGRSALHYQQHLNRTLVNAFIKGGANLEAKDGAGRTPLLLAVHLGRFYLVQQFIDLGANIYARDSAGRSAWNLAPAGNEEGVGWLARKAIKRISKVPWNIKSYLDEAAKTRPAPRGWKI
jgi:ankyrin repeat protein